MIIGTKNSLKTIDPITHWNLLAVGADKAWNFTQGSSEIIVAVIDSGIDFTHPDLVNQSWTNSDEIADNGLDDDNNGYIDDIHGWDVRDNDSDPSPGHWHGTFVAGLIAADDDNDLSVGIAPKISLMNLRFLDDSNSYSGSDYGMFAEAINYAVDNGAHIIHMSIYDYGIPPSSLHSAIQRAYSNGVIIVSITGNTGGASTYPGNYPEVIAVSATTKAGIRASFSGRGEQNEICAPGSSIWGIKPGYSELSGGNWGTSFAAPLVSGTIALMLTLNNSLTINATRHILHTTAVDLGSPGKDDDYGYGLLSASAALEMTVYGNFTPHPTTSATPTTPSLTTSSLTTTSQPPTVNETSFSLNLFSVVASLSVVAIILRRRKNSKM
ncbi:MAG: S8 family serine peptidase [Promethearchaeota archaeon]